MKTPQSFVMVLRRRYRVYFNPQGAGWYTAYTVDGKRERISLGVATRPEAENAVKLMDAPPDQSNKQQELKWSALQQGFLDHKRTTGKAPKTITRYTTALNAFGRYLASRNVDRAESITLDVLEGYIPYRTGKESCDGKTAYTDALVIKGAFKWASKASRKLLAGNSATDWETPEPIKPKRRTYVAADVAAMEAGVRWWLQPVITTLAWTGMRIEELCNLRWRDVDLNHRVIHIRVQEEWRPKGRRDRTVSMHPTVEAVLRKQPVGEKVFRGPQGGRMRESRCLRCLKIDQEKLGLQLGDLHGFRRFFATTMMQVGVSAETVRQWGGWKSLETMMRYLADVDVKDSVAAMDQAAKKLAAS
jgi:integrase